MYIIWFNSCLLGKVKYCIVIPKLKSILCMLIGDSVTAQLYDCTGRAVALPLALAVALALAEC